MIVEAGGGKGGFKEYLEHGVKVGRDFHRNELDQRVPLVGDLAVFELATSLHLGKGRTYDHITLSFSEQHVTQALLEMAVREFVNHALFAWPMEDRHRVPVYAEAHRPKLQSYINLETGEDVQRFTHIHIGIGRHDLLTGQAIEPLGFLGLQTDNLKYLDAWQESFNARCGLTSPKDNPKITPENAIDVIARYTGNKPDAMGSHNSRKAALEIALQKEIIAQGVTRWEDLAVLLARHGAVSIMNPGRFNECYRIKPLGASKAMRLKGVFFQRQFIERPTAEKTAILMAKAKVAYLEQMQPRKEPLYVAGILTEWQTTKARELRYLNTGSSHYKHVYLPADAQTRQQILNELERKNNAVKSPSNDQGRKTAPARNRLPGMRIRNLDGIQRRTEMLLHNNAGMDVRAAFPGSPVGVELRQTDGGGARPEGRIVGGSGDIDAINADLNFSREIRRRERSVDAGRHEDAQPRDGTAGYFASEWRHPMGGSAAIAPSGSDLHLQKGKWDGGETDVRAAQGGQSDVRSRIDGQDGAGLTPGHGGRLLEGNKHVQPSSVLARVQAEMLERYEQADDKEKYAEIRKNIDCAQLLSRLSHSHGLNPGRYRVAFAQDGTPRIQCGARALSPSDFLMKELGLPWKEAAPYLRQTYAHQLGKRVTMVRENAAPAALRREFKADQLAGKVAAAERLLAFDTETKKRLALLVTRLNTDSANALAGLTGARQKAEQALAALGAATAKAAFRDQRRALRNASEPTQAQAWRLFLQSQAQAGSEAALGALRKLDDTARAAPAESISGTLYLDGGKKVKEEEQEQEEKKRRLLIKSTSSILQQLAPFVEINGDITYRRGGQAVLRDEGMRLVVLDPNSDEAIAAALLLGREKFGADLTLTGPPAFQRRVVAVAVTRGSPIRFVDPQLEAIRVALTNEKRQASQPLMQAKVVQSPPASGQARTQAVHQAMHQAEPQAEPSHRATAAPLTPANKVARQGRASSPKEKLTKPVLTPTPVIEVFPSNAPEEVSQVTAADATGAPLAMERVAAAHTAKMTGTVKAVDGRQFALAKNREGDLVWHDMDNLPGCDLPKVGDTVNIEYLKGVGQVAVKVPGQGLGR